MSMIFESERRKGSKQNAKNKKKTFSREAEKIFFKTRLFFIDYLNPLSANATKWSNT